MGKYSSNLLSTHLISLLFLFHTSIITTAQQTADPYLLYANRQFIRRVNLESTSGQRTLYEGVDTVTSYTGMDLDMRTGLMYLSDNFRFNIYVGHTNGSIDGTQQPQQLVSTEERTNVEGIAWDWINRKLYWTNLNEMTVEVMDPLTGHRKVLQRFEANTGSSPRNIVLDPLRRLMYWSAWDFAMPTSGKVFRASMDGNDRSILLDSDDVTWPNGLALDFETQTLYMADANRDRFAKLTADTNFTVIRALTGRANPVSLDFYEGSLYWGDLFADRIFTLSVDDPSTITEAGNGFGRDIGGLKVVDPRRQPLGPNPCGTNNGGCSHLCLISASEPSGYSCVCPDNIEDPSSCSGPTTGSTTGTSGGPGTSTDVPSRASTGLPIPATNCLQNPCLNNGVCSDLPQGGVVCSCAAGFTGPYCSMTMCTCTDEVRSSSSSPEFVVSGGVFLAVTGALLAIILILTFIIAVMIFTTVKAKQVSRAGSKRNSIAGLTDSSPRDSPTHVVVGRLSDHDYISIKSRDSPAPRGIVINIENLGGRCTPNQYTIHSKGNHSSLPSNLVMHNGVSQTPTADTLPVPNKHHGNGTIEMNTNLSDSDTESEYNSLEPRVDVTVV